MKNKLKLLMISSSSSTGGGPSHIFLLEKLIRNEFDIFFAMPNNIYLEKFKSKKFIEIEERKISIFDIFRLIKFIRRNSIDIFHAHGKGAGLIGRILKIFTGRPLIYTFHGVHINCLNNFQKLIYLVYENIFGWLDDKKIFVSESEKKVAKRLIINVLNNYKIINNSVTNKSFKKNTDNKVFNNSIGIQNDKKNIISICRLVEQKNIFEIFKIARILPQYNFIILGNGYLFNKAKDFLKLNRIQNVYILGNKKNVYKYLYNSQLFLSTSLYEGHPISILEAMSVGLPILASNVTGNIDTIENKLSGYYYKLGDIKKAAIMAKKILEDKKLKLSFSINSFELQRKKFSTSKMKQYYIDLYSEFNTKIN